MLALWTKTTTWLDTDEGTWLDTDEETWLDTDERTWLDSDEGASMVEYALLVVLIAIVALVAVRVAGTEVSETFADISSGLENAPPTTA